MKILISFILMISCTVIANLLLKSGATGLIEGVGNYFSRLLTFRVLLGFIFFAFSALLYFLILSWLPLGVAQSFAAAQFVAVVFSSWLILSEPIAIGQLIGMCMITFGIVVVGWFTK
jgi:drug/metabolite transporter (DMT)-like permease